MEKVVIGNCELYCGDCFEILPQLDVEVDVVISDPPYSSSFGRCTDLQWDKPIPLAEFWQLMETKTKSEANIVLFCNLKFGVDLIMSKKEWFRYDLIWAKNNRCGFLNAALQPLRAHEQILVFGRPGFRETATYNPLKLPGGRPFVKKTKKRKGSVYPSQDHHTTVSDGTIHPSSVLMFDNDRQGNQSDFCHHPTMKPLLLNGWLVYTYSNLGDCIIDPFCGSGTTLLAAAKLGRKAIGIERERKYFDIACRRLDEEMSKWKRAG